MKKLGKFSFGIGDRFGHQGVAQLQALIQAKKDGVFVTPVWNKSFREHYTIKSKPADTRIEADNAIKQLGWKEDYFVDADHVGLKTVDLFLESSDYFTIDVADFIGKAASEQEIKKFAAQHQKYVGTLVIPNIQEPFKITSAQIKQIAGKYLFAIEEAGKIYRHISEHKKDKDFVIEVSMDETRDPQTPLEMLFILAGLAQENIPVQTIAPKFTGRFNKGVDYIGDLKQFTREFEEDLAIIAFAVTEFSLALDLKLSVHSGSDKFAIYGPIRNALKKFDAGLHVKTAGTTWLEEMIGLAEAGGQGLEIAKQIYRQAFARFDELSQPYATVIDIDPAKLPSPEKVRLWDEAQFTSALRHDQSSKSYNLHFRQLLHVGYKIAAEMGSDYTDALSTNEEIIARNVTENIYERHLKRIFI